jgi:hypothetical protein
MRDPQTPMTQNIADQDRLAARRKGVRRTAWVIGGLALAIYVLFLLSGIIGR